VGWNRGGTSVTISYRALQKRTGRSSEAISKALKVLHDEGLIHIVRRRSDRIPNKLASESEEQQYTERE
jgi:DNA-binding GntR family transcriptional regulator